MYLGANYCHQVIRFLNVGDTLVFTTLGAVAVGETLLLWFLVHAWRTRADYVIGVERTLAHAVAPARSQITDATRDVLGPAVYPAGLVVVRASEALT